MFSSLNEQSPRIVETFEDVCPLFLHQQSSIRAMQRLEESSHNVIQISDDTTMETSMGMLCDKPGSGKSFTALAHISLRPILSMEVLKPAKTFYRSNGYSIFRVRNDQYEHVLKTNLLIVPRSVYFQWVTYCKEYVPSLSIFHSDKYVVGTSNRVLSGEYDIAILYDTQYKKFMSESSFITNTSKYKFQRVVIDEVDTINIPSFKMPQSNFLWLITGSSPKFFESHGLRAYLLKSQQEQNYIVRNVDEFIDASLRIPRYEEERVSVECSFSSMRNLLPENILSALDAGDMGSAISMLGCTSVSTDEGLVAAFTSHIDMRIKSLRSLIETSSIDTIPSLTKRIEELERKRTMCLERITQTECCPIGMDEIVNKAIVPCCQGAFELSNLVQALRRASVCPLCRANLTVTDIVIKTSIDIVPSSSRKITKEAALDEKIQEIFERSPDAKVLICSMFSMYKYIPVIQKSNIQHDTICGTPQHIKNVIDMYNTGKVKILWYDARHYGCGVNLEQTTHIITLHSMMSDMYRQLVGRAQRPGRTIPLKVINILYQHEVNNTNGN